MICPCSHLCFLFASTLTWQHAVTAEVFSLNNLFTVLLLWTVIEFSDALNNPANTARVVYISKVGAFLCGLAGTNQHTIVLFEVC